MSKAQRLEAKLKKLSPAALQKIRAWLDGALEDQSPVTNESKAPTKKSGRKVPSGARPRTRRP